MNSKLTGLNYFLLFMIDFKQKMEEEQKQANPGYDPEWEKLLAASKKRRRLITYIIALVAIGIIFTGRVIMSSQSASGWFGENSWFGKLKHLTGISDNKLKGEEDDRVNILLLGMGGSNHEGGYLTDTIMLASLKPSTGQVALISIPRDLTVPIGNSGWRKINNINALAEAKNPGSGSQASIDALSDLLGIPIKYYVRADFAGFVEVINELGGIEVNVENVLNDYEYPIMGQEDNPNYYARYEHLYIPTGPQKMDGELALKYARSRHAAGAEGSDFARSRRQQLIMEAVKEKLLSRDNLLKPVMIAKIINQLETHISTNLEIWEMVRLWDLTKNIGRDNIINKVIDNSPDSFLIDSRGEDGAYILVPRSGNFTQIKNFVQNIFGDNNSKEDGTDIGLNNFIKSTGRQKSTSSSRVEVMNGTWISGLAGQKAGLLKESNFKVTKVGNAAARDYTKTLVYDLSYGKKDADLKLLISLTGAEQAFDSPDWLSAYTITPASSSPENIQDVSTSSLMLATSTASSSLDINKDIPDFILILGSSSTNY